MARMLTAVKQLDDMTECSICTEVFTDPRVLPCIHTFCLKCLLNYGKDRQPGDSMACPLCRKQFTIPDDGLSGTQKNFFMEKLLHVRKLSAEPRVRHIPSFPCDVCGSDEAGAGETIKPAPMYCVQCQQKYCEQCSLYHRKMKSSSSHSQVVIGKESESVELIAKISPAMCDQHKSEEIKVFCQECKIAICLMCFIKSHKTHDCSDIEEVSDNLRRLVTVKQEVEQRMTALESFKRYSEMLLSSGTACDVTRSANSLHDRADELMKFDVIGHVDNSLPSSVNVTFTSSTLLSRDDDNLVGTITEGDSNSSSPTVIHVTPQGNAVVGVTSLGDDVFVVRHNSQQKIEVYDAKTFTLQRHITVPGLGDYSHGLAACPHNNCLYASDNNNSVHRVELSGRNAVMKLSVARSPVGLSVNSEHNLLVVSLGERKLQIFTTDGTLLQNIQLQADIEYLRHAVQLPTGQFLVSHSGSLHRVCLVGVDGAVVHSYGGQEGSQLTQMYVPAGLAVDREGRVLVADQYNNRLLVIDQSLSSAHEISVCVDGGLNGPYSLWYDQSRRRLYIGERHRLGGRVIVIGNLKDFRIN